MDVNWLETLQHLAVITGNIVQTIFNDLQANSFLMAHWKLLTRFYLNPLMYLPLIYFIVLLVLWYRFGRDNKAHWTDSVEYKPPQDLEPWKAFIILKQGVYSKVSTSQSLSRILSSILLSLYYCGNIELIVEKKHLVRIKAVKEPDSNTRPLEKSVYRLLLGYDTEVDLRRFKKGPFILKARELIIKETGVIRPEIMTQQSLRISNAVGGFITGVLDYVNTVSIMYICTGLEFLFMGFLMALFLSAFGLFSALYFLVLPWSEKGHDKELLLLLGGYAVASFLFWFGANRFRKTKAWKNTRAFLHKCWSHFEYPVYIVLKAVSYLFIYLAFTLWLGLPLSIAFSITLCLILSLIFTPLLPQWNQEALEKLRRLRGYKIFLKKVEVPVIKQLAEQDPNLFQIVLPYAVIFGYARRWQKILKHLGIDENNLSIISDLQLYLTNISGEAENFFKTDMMADNPPDSSEEK